MESADCRCCWPAADTPASHTAAIVAEAAEAAAAPAANLLPPLPVRRWPTEGGRCSSGAASEAGA